MLLIENIRIALNGLWVNKMRALLTMLGIIIGIGSVIGIVNVGNSMTNGISDSMAGMGISNITVSLVPKTEDNAESNRFLMFGRSSPDEKDLISEEIINEYRTMYSDYISNIYITENAGSTTAEYNSARADVVLTGTNEEYAQANNIDILTGRFISRTDNEKRKKVCVVSSDLCGRLMPGQDPVGKTLDMTAGNRLYTFYILGVYDEPSSSPSQTAVYIPLSVAQQITGADSGYQSFTVVPAAGTDTTALMSATDSFFTQVYSRNEAYTASASNMEAMVESMTEMLSTVSLAIAVIAGISLLVGGIGVMNIMLVSITERTREIGTRKALGATNNSIRMQFIVESVVICMLGGIIGVGLGLLIGNVGSSLLGYSATVSLSTIVVAVAFSMAIGVFFGFYPANKAAKMNPIEALRYE